MLSEEASYRVGAELGPSSRVVQKKMKGWGGGLNGQDREQAGK